MKTTRAVEYGYKCDACDDIQPGIPVPGGWKTFIDAEESDFRNEEMAHVDLCAACVDQLPPCMQVMKIKEKSA